MKDAVPRLRRGGHYSIIADSTKSQTIRTFVKSVVQSSLQSYITRNICDPTRLRKRFDARNVINALRIKRSINYMREHIQERCLNVIHVLRNIIRRRSCPNIFFVRTVAKRSNLNVIYARLRFLSITS